MKNFIELDLPRYNYEPLVELSKLLSLNKLNWGTRNQICLNSLPEHGDNFLLGAGSLTLDWENSNTQSVSNTITKIKVSKKINQLTESEFTVLCDQFKGTVFETIYNMLNQQYILGRVRIMKSDPNTCLSWHNDNSGRLHYPLSTHSGCFMVIEDEVMHLEYNKWYMTDTTKKHTAFNGSKNSRIHLVAVILGKL